MYLYCVSYFYKYFNFADMFNLTKHIIQYEIDNAPSYLYIQDKHFMSNIFSTLNRILSRKYEKNILEYW